MDIIQTAAPRGQSVSARTTGGTIGISRLMMKKQKWIVATVELSASWGVAARSPRYDQGYQWTWTVMKKRSVSISLTENLEVLQNGRELNRIELLDISASLVFLYVCGCGVGGGGWGGAEGESLDSASKSHSQWSGTDSLSLAATSPN